MGTSIPRLIGPPVYRPPQLQRPSPPPPVYRASPIATGIMRKAAPTAQALRPVVQPMRTRARTLNDLQASSDLDPRLIVDEPRTRRGVERYGHGDGTTHGVGP